MFQKWMPRLKKQYKIDSIVINGENAADNGKGITKEELLQYLKENKNEDLH